MATWVVGDVQGCFATFRALLGRIDWRPEADRLWFVGDLVNRGPDSLGMLRWVTEQDAAHPGSVVSVLGNHDLHLLARREGILAPSRRDTLDPVLEAPDADELCDWLAARPFLHREGAHLLLHAGVLPAWSLADLERNARAAEDALRGDRRGFLSALYAIRGQAPAGAEDDDAAQAGAHAASVLTRIRAVDASGAPVYDFDGPPEEMPAGLRPWFEVWPERQTDAAEATILFGHWAALGLMVSPRAVALDSGCVWGASLTAMRLEDGALSVQPTAVGDGQPF